MKCFVNFVLTFVVFTLGHQALGQSGGLSKYDQLKSQVQKICPVSGEMLGSMGEPIKVQVGAEDIFLCCKSCASKQINKTHWLTIHKNFAGAQGICPVMEKPLPKAPKSTVIHGQTVYVCCPPCTKKIQADPKKYLTKLASYYQKSATGKSLSGKSVAASGPLSKRAEKMIVEP